jgi:hypothetical protein
MNNYNNQGHNNHSHTTGTDSGAAPYYNNDYSQPAPPYTPPANTNTGTATSYYGNEAQTQQQTGIELQNNQGIQQPGSTYQPPGSTPYGGGYAPPPGPPPAKY